MVPFFVGLSLAFGPTGLWPLATLITASIWIFGIGRGKPKWRYDWRSLPPLALIVGSLAISAIHSEYRAYAFLLCEVIAIQWLAGQGIKFGKLSMVPIVVFVCANAIYSMWQIEVVGLGRPDGFGSNATQLGLTGMANLPFGAVLVGLSQSRTAMLALVFYGVVRCRFWIGGLLAVGAVAFVLVGGVNRLENVGTDINWRTQIISGNVVGVCDSPSETLIDGGNRPWKWQGYGYQNSCSVGLVTPHNIYVISFYELGVLVVPFWIGVAWLWWMKGRSIAILLVVGISGLFMQNWFDRIEGIYAIITLYVVDREMRKLKWESSRHLLVWFLPKLDRSVFTLKSFIQHAKRRHTLSDSTAKILP